MGRTLLRSVPTSLEKLPHGIGPPQVEFICDQSYSELQSLSLFRYVPTLDASVGDFIYEVQLGTYVFFSGSSLRLHSFLS